MMPDLIPTRFKVVIAWEGGNTWDWFECERCAHRFRDYKLKVPRQCPSCLRYGKDINQRGNERGNVSLTGQELVDFLFRRYPAAQLSVEANNTLDSYSELFYDLATHIAQTADVTPEQTLAFRALHEAHRAAIFALVAHQ